MSSRRRRREVALETLAVLAERFPQHPKRSKSELLTFRATVDVPSRFGNRSNDDDSVANAFRANEVEIGRPQATDMTPTKSKLVPMCRNWGRYGITAQSEELTAVGARWEAPSHLSAENISQTSISMLAVYGRKW